MREKKIHFVTGLRRDFGGKPFVLPHLLAILSARLVYPDHEVFVHYEHEPFGRCWAIAKRYVTLVRITAPTEIFGQPINHFAHAADVVRLRALIEEGGIYFDFDTLIYRSIDDLPDDRVIMGVEATNEGNIGGICNAFIAAPSHAPFLLKWYESYRDFDGADWNRHSVRRPYELAQDYPDLIHVEPRQSFFFPHHDPESLRDLFVRSVDVSRSYSIHLWESLSWEHLRVLTTESIAQDETTYTLRAREVLSAFPEEIKNMSGYEDVAEESMSRSFEAVYSQRKWGGGSGTGSGPKNNIEYSAFITRFMERNDIGSVVDLGCGDWQFSRYINWEGISYLGVDVVTTIVEQNAKAFATDTVKFQVFSGLGDLPPADLLLCKDVMQHWPNDMVAHALRAIRGKYRYVLLTNDEEPLDRQNQDIPLAGWRALDVRKPPFNQRAATVLSWHVYDGTLVRKATMLLLDT